MKGITPIVILIIAAIAASATFLVYTHYLIGQTVYFSRFMKDIEIINAINSFYLTKLALSQSLVYSFYQGFYDAFVKYQGFQEKSNTPSKNGIYYWRSFGEVFEPDFTTLIDELSLNYFNEYKKEIARKSGINIPLSSHFEFEFDPTGKIVNLFSNSSEKISLASKDGKITLKAKDETFEEKHFGTSFYRDLLEFSNVLKERFVTNDIIKESFSNAKQEVKRGECDKKDIWYCENNEPSVSVPQECRKEFKAKVKKILKNSILKGKPSSLYIDVSIQEEDYEFPVSKRIIESYEDQSCGCKKTKTEIKQINCSEAENYDNVIRDAEGNCYVEEEKCVEYYKKVHAEYDFNYKGYIEVLVKVKDNLLGNYKIPVYNWSSAKIEFSYPHFQFLAISGTINKK